MITVENVTKTFGERVLFDSISFTINPRERVGLVGRNGHGKTTLFRMITGEEYPDSGNVIIPRNYTIGYVSQYLHFTRDTVIDEGCLGLPKDRGDERWQVEKILFGLGFERADMVRRPSEFSGGYQVRLNLAKVLVSEPNLLLLDEPTNYLDITSIRWLSRFLTAWNGELMLITHDRGFMDGLITHTLGIHRSRVRKIAGTTNKLYAQIIKEEEIHEKTRINDEKKRKEVEEFITRFRAKARLANLVQSRVKQLEKREKLQQLEQIKTLDFWFTHSAMPGKHILSAEDICFSYDAKPPYLIENFSITIGAHDRICVTGKNGKGKSTLLRLLAGDLRALTGELRTHPHVKPGYYAQTNAARLRDTFTVEEEILSACGDNDRQRARNICGAMIFEGDDALKPVSILSGGEKSRVMLGRIIAEPANLLLLDEPTNHLDMESCDALLAAVDSFEGAVVMVTHNETFLHALATRIIAFQDGKIIVHEGNYASFLEKIGWEDERADNEPTETKRADTEAIVNRKELRRIRSEMLTRRSKALKPLENDIHDTENAIMGADEKLSQQNDMLIAASHTGDGRRIADLSKEIHATKIEIDRLYGELERLTVQFEEESARFEREIDLLGQESRFDTD